MLQFALCLNGAGPVMPLALEDFDYALPEELIAQFPAPERSASRTMLSAPRLR